MKGFKPFSWFVFIIPLSRSVLSGSPGFGQGRQSLDDHPVLVIGTLCTLGLNTNSYLSRYNVICQLSLEVCQPWTLNVSKPILEKQSTNLEIDGKNGFIYVFWSYYGRLFSKGWENWKNLVNQLNRQSQNQTKCSGNHIWRLFCSDHSQANFMKKVDFFHLNLSLWYTCWEKWLTKSPEDLYFCTKASHPNF